MSFAFAKSKTFLEKALAERQASAVALLVQHKNQEHSLYLGNTAHENTGAIRAPVTADSLFDLASLTKILSTLSLLFIAESEDRLKFTDLVQKYFPKFPDANTTLLELMNHTSGLPSHIEFFKRYERGDAQLGDDRAVLPWICELNLGEKKQVYSDLGPILLGFLLEDIYGKSIPELFFEKIGRKLKLERTGFVALPQAKAAAKIRSLVVENKYFVATETCPWRKKTLQGEVHDDNTWAMGGYAGHAGLFSTLQETKLCFAHLLRQTRANPDFLNSARAAAGAFDFGFMMYPGLRASLSPAFNGALGHTGFVGTSVWSHPSSDTIVILLANRVHPSRADARWIDTRLEFHKILWQELGL